MTDGSGPPGRARSDPHVPCDVVVEMTPLTRQARGEPAIAHVREALASRTPCHHREQGTRGLGLLRSVATGRGRAAAASSTRRGHGRRSRLQPRASRPARGDGDARRRDPQLDDQRHPVRARARGARSRRPWPARSRRATRRRTPRDDLEGWDGAVKLSALANALMGDRPAPGDDRARRDHRPGAGARGGGAGPRPRGSSSSARPGARAAEPGNRRPCARFPSAIPSRSWTTRARSCAW